MSMKGKLRAVGAIVLLANLWAIGRFDLGHIPTLLLTFGFAFAYELWVVRGAEDHFPKAFSLIGLCAVIGYFGAVSGSASRSAETRSLVAWWEAGTPVDPAQVAINDPYKPASDEIVDPFAAPTLKPYSGDFEPLPDAEPNPFAKYVQPSAQAPAPPPIQPTAQVDPIWHADITRWERRNADFLADPWRKEVMEAVLANIEANTPGLQNSVLIREAERMAFNHTGWRQPVAVASTPAPTRLVAPEPAPPEPKPRIINVPEPIGGTPAKLRSWSDMKPSTSAPAEQ